MTAAPLLIYTTSLCADCWRVKAVLRKLGLPFVEIDILAAPEQGEEMVQRSGQRRVPTVILPDGAVLVEPDNLTLVTHLAPLLERMTPDD